MPPPVAAALGRRYAEVLAENLGQPGFRELMLVATDLDARRDVVGALLREPYRAASSWRRAPAAIGAPEVLDLAGAGRDHAIDLVAAALTPPVGVRPAARHVCARQLLARRNAPAVRSAGLRCTGCSRKWPRPASTQVDRRQRRGAGRRRRTSCARRASIRGSRLGEFIAAAEAAALRDALETARLRFDAST